MGISMQTRPLSVHGHVNTLAFWQSPAGEAMQSTPIHFAQGNGFVAGVYRQMLERLAQQHSVYATHHRATWEGTAAHQPPSHFSWVHAAEDMIASLDALNAERTAQGLPTQRFIGVGHSLGGVMTLLAAHARPDLFERIVLIEPVLFPNRAVLTLKVMPMALRKRLLPMAKRTALRRDVWPSHQAFVDYHAPKSAFRGIPLSVMHDYAEHGLKPRSAGEGLELSFPKAWEAHIFRSLSSGWRALSELRVPCVAIRGEQSQWIPERSWQKWQRLRPDLPVIVMPQVGHMSPLQQPELMAQLLLQQMA